MASVLVRGDGKGKSAVGDVYSPGLFSVTCVVHVQQQGVANSDAFYSFTNSCAVIGGPLTFTPESYSYPARHEAYFVKYFTMPGGDTVKYNDTVQASPFTRDCIAPDQENSDPTKPYYLQYFGFDPEGPDGIPANTQSPRCHITVLRTSSAARHLVCLDC